MIRSVDDPGSGSTQKGDVTRVLRRYADGDTAAFDELVALVYPELRHMARGQLRRRRFGQTLETTGLVHELYLKMVDKDEARFEDRSHFYAISARAMREIIIDHARRKQAAKRGGGAVPEEIDEERVAAEREEAAWVLAVEEALEKLSAIDPRMEQVVECRFFAGMTEEETAEALGLSLRTVQRTWKRARLWLRRELAGE